MCNSNVVPYLHIDTDTLRTNYRHTDTRRFSSINESPGPSRNTKTHSLPRYFYIHPINLNNPLSLSLSNAKSRRVPKCAAFRSIDRQLREWMETRRLNVSITNRRLKIQGRLMATPTSIGPYLDIYTSQHWCVCVCVCLVYQ